MIRSLRIRFDWQIVPFFLSAVVGLVIAYDTLAACTRFALILAGLVLYLFFANKTEPTLFSEKRSGLRMTLALTPAVIAVYFLLSNDWSRSIDKLPLLSSLTQGLAFMRIAPSALQLNPNVVGGVIAAGLPLQIEALRGSRRTAKALLIGLSLFGLVLSAARGAWLALTLAAGMWLLWKLLNQRVTDLRRAHIAWSVIVAIVGLIGIALLAGTPLGDSLLGLGGQRPDIWRNSLALVGDYPFTGFGLGSFDMAYSTYALLVHVGHTLHAHNLWLDIWLDMGLLGVIAFSGMVLNAVWPRPDTSHWRTAALASLAVILLHGMVDDPFYGYGGAAIPLLFVPLALLIRPAEQEVSAVIEPKSAGVKAVRSFQPALALWGMAITALFFSIIIPNGRAAMEANIGAVLQTRAELSIYDWPKYGLQDVVRRSGAADLSGAIGWYQAALETDPTSVTANRRLGQIQLALGQVETACKHLESAFTAAQQRATNQLLGECYALRGKTDQAVQLWRTIDMSEGQLTYREWWYASYLAKQDMAARLNQAATAFGGN